MAPRGLYHNLEKRRNGWYVWLDVPPSLRERIGRRRLRETTGTSDKQQAVLRRGPILHEFRMRIARERKAMAQESEGGLVGEALAWKREIADEANVGHRDILEAVLAERAEAIERASDLTTAMAFHDVATGKATPITLHLEGFLEERTFKDRQKSETRNAVAKLGAWLRAAGMVESLEAITDKVAASFKTAAIVKTGVNFKTGNKWLWALRTYWRWLVSQGHVNANPWLGKSLPKVRVSREEKERPFTDDEVETLLNGGADQDMHDLMLCGCLTGMRLDEIYQLKAKHCRNGVFAVVGGKTAAAERDVPIHSALKAVVARRLKGKGDDGFLFEKGSKGWDAVRSTVASKRFTTYRQRLGVDAKVDGKRRSLVNFHSFRRWFITKADQAGCRREDIERTVGHKAGGQSLGGYSGGITLEQRRAVVEAVRLPKGVKPPSPKSLKALAD